MCLSETYSEVHAGKKLPNLFPIQNDLKERDALLPLFFNFVLGALLEGQRKLGGTEI